MNTGKQINAMVVVLFLTLIAVGIYAVWDPFRAESKEDIQLELTVERAAEAFTQNCRLCHGDAGQGGAGGSGRLGSAAQLDTGDLRGIDGGAFDQAAFDDAFKLVSNTIMCGRVGSAMPAWGEAQGGTLNEEQMRQLTVLITGGDPNLGIYHEEGFWEEVQQHADELDAETTRHAVLAMPDGSLSATATEVFVNDAGPFGLGQYIRIPIEGEEGGEERLRILPNALRVERAVEGTTADGHDVGAAVLDDNGDPVLDRMGENEQALIEEMNDESTLVVVGDSSVFAAGDVIQIDSERLEVTDVVRGLPATGQRVVREVGREPKTILISGSQGISEDMTVRIDSEILRIIEINDAGETDIILDAAAAAGDDIVFVSDPAFFAENYIIRVGDELMRVIEQVETGQELAETIGRANTRFTISGTDGIEPDDILRLDRELLRVIEILEQARIDVTRTEEGAASHDAGTEIMAVIAPEEEGGEVTLEPTGVFLTEDADSSTTEFVLTSVGRLSAGSLYMLDDEEFTIEDVLPARIRAERAVEGTEAVPHGRRLALFAGTAIEVERGFDGTTAAAHDEGDDVQMTEIRVERAVEDSELLDHAKNAELYLGNSLIVERGVLDTEAAEHEGGAPVLDFPAAPDGPPTLMQSCGQFAGAGEGPTEEPTPIAGSTAVNVALTEWEVDPVPANVATGLLSFIIGNEGETQHNLRVIATDLAPDALPLDGTEVDESQLNVAGTSQNIGVGGFGSVFTTLEPGSYVLICNIPTHYQNGMFTSFDVTP